MQKVVRRLAGEKEAGVMKMQNTQADGKPLGQKSAEAMFHALRGVHRSAARLNAQLEAKGRVKDPDAGIISPATIAKAARDAIRLAGIRDILVVGHPVVDRMLAALAADCDRIPTAKRHIVDKLAKLDGFAFDGKVVTIHGVPVPAGKRQTSWFMVTRYRHLYAPGTLAYLVYRRDDWAITEADHKALGIVSDDKPDFVHLLAYDAAHTTDDMQETLLSYSTGMHRENLIRLQEDHPALYVALWRRDMATAKTLVRRLRNAALPRSNPKSRIRSHGLRLMFGTALMNEHERLFEIIDAVRADRGVTRQTLAAALMTSTSMTAVRAVDDDPHQHLSGAIVQVRSLHPTMNDKPSNPRTGDPILERARIAHANTRGFHERTKRIRWIAGDMPAAWFCGVEPAFLAPVALIHMVRNMARREGAFWLRGTRDQAPDVDEQRRSLTIRLAVIITANICAATGRSMLPADQTDRKLAAARLTRIDEAWRDAVVPTLVANPRIAEQVERRLAEIRNEGEPEPRIAIVDESDRPHHSSPYDRAQERCRAFFDIGEPGWTQGFFFEAWLRPDAEIAFLLQCCRYLQYDPAEAAKREAWDAAVSTVQHADGTPMTSAEIATGLPRQHPVECVQDLFRGPFERLQVPDLVPERWTADQRAWRETMVREIAPLLAAVSPVTLDPQRAEWWGDDLDPTLKAIAVQGAWNS